MSDKNGDDFGAFLAGFVIGGLVGAATALILAPQSGEKTREQIINRGHALQEVGGERFQQYRDTATTSLSGTRERVQEAGGQAQEQARIVLDAGREQAAKVREQVATVAQEAGSSVAESADSAADKIEEAEQAVESAAENAAERIAPEEDAAEGPKEN